MSIKYIFSINCGRSGSQYLSNILSLVDGISAFHEQEPIGNMQAIRDFQSGRFDKLDILARNKVSAIKMCMGENKVYLETNHCFIKSFGWKIPEYIKQEEIGVVVLRRCPEKIANSLFRIGCQPFNYVGKDWILLPYRRSLKKSPICHWNFKAQRLIFRVLKKTQNFSHLNIDRIFRSKSIQILEWYVEETEALYDAYKKEFPNIAFFETSIEEVNSQIGIENLLKAFDLNLALGPDAINAIGKKANEKK